MDNDRINEFKDRAARRLKPIFEKDLNELSAELIDQLERLRQLEKQMLKAARKNLPSQRLSAILSAIGQPLVISLRGVLRGILRLHSTPRELSPEITQRR